jgi:hypothetical protein
VHNIGKAKHHGIGFQPFPGFGGALRSEADDIDWLHDNPGADPSNSMMVRIPNHHVRVIIAPGAKHSLADPGCVAVEFPCGAPRVRRDTLPVFAGLTADRAIPGRSQGPERKASGVMTAARLSAGSTSQQSA